MNETLARLWDMPEREARHPVFWPGTCSSPVSGVGCWSPEAQVLMLISRWVCPCPPPPPPALEREKRDSQDIIDTLRATLEERNATVESLQRALDEAEMLCSTLTVGPQVLWAQLMGDIAPTLGSPR